MAEDNKRILSYGIQNIQENLSQYHSRWWHGSLSQRTINSHVINDLHVRVDTRLFESKAVKSCDFFRVQIYCKIQVHNVVTL